MVLGLSSGVGVVACVVWRFWLGALSNKGGRGQRNREFRRSCARLDKTAMLRRLSGLENGPMITKVMPRVMPEEHGYR